MLLDIEDRVVTECSRGESRSHMERFRIIAVVVPIDIGRRFRSRIIAIHAPLVDTFCDRYGSRIHIADRVNHTIRSSSLVAAVDHEVIGIVGLVGVGGEHTPDVKVVYRVKKTVGRQMEFHTCGDAHRVFGRYCGGNRYRVEFRIADTIYQLERYVCCVGQRMYTAVANQDHHLDSVWHAAHRGKRVD